MISSIEGSGIEIPGVAGFGWGFASDIEATDKGWVSG
jgi:hypothetical protein